MHKALADPTRLRILQRLSQGEGTVGDLMRHVDLSQPLVSWHLRRLRAAGLVETRRVGREVICSLGREALERFHEQERELLGTWRVVVMSKGSFISPEQRSGIRASVEPLALAMARAGLTPNMLTLIGFGIASLGGLMAALEWWLLAGIVATAGAGFDMFDGAVARATGTGQQARRLHGQHLRPLGRGRRLRGHRHRLHPGRLRPGRLARGRRARLGLHGQLRPRQERVRWASPAARAWPPSASRRARCARSSSASPSSGRACSAGSRRDLSDLGTLVLAAGLALIAVLATITVIQRVLFVTAQPPNG